PAGERRAASAAANEASPLGGNLFQGAPPSADAQREKRSDADAEAKQAPPLDRVQVTGARIGSGGADEHNLPAPQWLDLIRDYRDSGQTDRARESLLQFRREHPRVRIPKDLRPLLK
ncbi:hypothetical protein, partial [Pseudomonas sp. CGJS7]|uniref:hypothetical protein n=1 Tax=Pseudomonas sp. CGJS7 TaxID=3109348 RepID=UPI00300B2022